MTSRDFDRILKHFGKERLVAALPQKEVCNVLGLVCVREMSRQLGMGYDEFRRLMEAGEIPFPEVRLRRRCYFTADEVVAVKEQLERQKKKSLALNRKDG